MDYDISTANNNGDQAERSPAHSPKRHIKRPRHLTREWVLISGF